MNPKKNVLFFITHDVGRRFGCLGGKAITPNIDRLAAEGVLFGNHFCNAPLCGPSRANIFTGLRPTTTGRYNMDPFFAPYRAAHPEFRSLSEIFRDNGYFSASAGFVLHDKDDGGYSVPEWYPTLVNQCEGRLGKLPPDLTHHWVGKESFDFLDGRIQAMIDRGEIDGETLRPHQAADKGCIDNDTSVMRKARGPMTECVDVEDNAYYDGQVADHAAEFIRGYDKNQPFYYAVGFVGTHTPYCIPKKYWDLYDRDQLQLAPYRVDPKDSPEWAGGDSEPAQYYTTNGYSLPWRASDEQSLEMLHGHLASASYVDAQIGKIIRALEDSGRREDTIIVFTTDHGYHDGEHGYWGKHNMWDRSFDVPLIISAPGEEKGLRIPAMTEHVDVYPTVCQLCGISVPKEIEGVSLVPLMHRQTESLHKAVYANRRHMWHDRIKAYDLGWSVRTQRCRFTSYLDKEKQEVYAELFDYETDPNETTNQIANPEYSAVLAEMRALLAEKQI